MVAKNNKFSDLKLCIFFVFARISCQRLNPIHFQFSLSLTLGFGNWYRHAMVSLYRSDVFRCRVCFKRH